MKLPAAQPQRVPMRIFLRPILSTMQKVTHWEIVIDHERGPFEKVANVIHTVMRKLVPATMILTAVGFSKPTLLKIVAELW